MASRFPRAAVIRLDTNYRSSPEILELANRLVPNLGGTRKILRPARPPGPAPVVTTFDGFEETRFVVERVRALHCEQQVPFGEIAVLYRTNARSEGYEPAFSEANIPYQVREGAFLTRLAARRLRAALAGSASPAVAASVRRAAERDGFVEALSRKLGEQELVRQADLARLVELARAFDDGRRTVADFFGELDRRFGPDADGRGGRSRRESEPRRARVHGARARTGPARARRRRRAAPCAPARVAPSARGGRRRPRVRRPPRPDARRARRADPEERGGVRAVPGIGPAKLERYGAELLAALATGRARAP